MSIPKFQTAIPKKRYQLGNYSTVLLGDIVSNDNVEYIFVLAFVKDGDQEPVLMISFEKSTNNSQYQLRAITPDQDSVMGESDQMMNSEQFLKGAMESGKEFFNLGDEEAYPIG